MPGLDEPGGGRRARRRSPRTRRSRRRPGTTGRASAAPTRRSTGKGVSPVTVAHTIRSTCSAEMPAVSRARVAASTARSEVTTPSSAKWRASMPVRSRIHSSVVSTLSSNHVFGTRRGGRTDPTPVMVACLVTGPRISERPALRRRPRRRRRASRPRSPVSAGIDPFHQLREHVAGPGLEERGGAGGGEAADAVSHRTGETTCRPTSSRSVAASVTSSPVTFSAIGNTGSECRSVASTSSTGCTAGSHQLRVERAGDRQPHGADLRAPSPTPRAARSRRPTR